MLQKTLKISRLKYKDSYVPKVRISALWLNDIGFSIGKNFFIDYSREHIIIKLFDTSTFNNQSCSKFDVKSLPNKSKTITIPAVEIKGLWLVEIGFNIGGKILINADFGSIDITPLAP